MSSSNMSIETVVTDLCSNYLNPSNHIWRIEYVEVKAHIEIPYYDERLDTEIDDELYMDYHKVMSTVEVIPQFKCKVHDCKNAASMNHHTYQDPTCCLNHREENMQYCEIDFIKNGQIRENIFKAWMKNKVVQVQCGLGNSGPVYTFVSAKQLA